MDLQHYRDSEKLEVVLKLMPPATNRSICSMSIINGSTTINISNNPGLGNRGPKLNENGQVVWYTHNSSTGADSEIYSYSGSAARNISNNMAREDHHPQINIDGIVVWFGVEGGFTNADINYSDGENATNLTKDYR